MDKYVTSNDSVGLARSKYLSSIHTNAIKTYKHPTYLEVKSLRRIEDHGYSATKLYPSRTTRKAALDNKMASRKKSDAPFPELSLATSRRLGLPDTGAQLNDAYQQSYFSASTRDAALSSSRKFRRDFQVDRYVNATVGRTAPAVLPSLPGSRSTARALAPDVATGNTDVNARKALEVLSPILAPSSSTCGDSAALAITTHTVPSSSSAYTILPSPMPSVSVAGTRQMTGLVAALQGMHPLVRCLDAAFVPRTLAAAETHLAHAAAASAGGDHAVAPQTGASACVRGEAAWGVAADLPPSQAACAAAVGISAMEGAVEIDASLPNTITAPAADSARVLVACTEEEVDLLPALACATHAALAATAGHFLGLHVREVCPTHARAHALPPPNASTTVPATAPCVPDESACACDSRISPRGRTRSRPPSPVAPPHARSVDGTVHVPSAAEAAVYDDAYVAHMRVQSALPPVLVAQSLPLLRSVVDAVTVAQACAVVPVWRAEAALRVGADIAAEEEDGDARQNTSAAANTAADDSALTQTSGIMGEDEDGLSDPYPSTDVLSSACDDSRTNTAVGLILAGTHIPCAVTNIPARALLLDVSGARTATLVEHNAPQRSDDTHTCTITPAFLSSRLLSRLLRHRNSLLARVHARLQAQQRACDAQTDAAQRALMDAEVETARTCARVKATERRGATLSAMLAQAKEEAGKLSGAVARALSVNAKLKHSDAVGARRAFGECRADAETIYSIMHQAAFEVTERSRTLTERYDHIHRMTTRAAHAREQAALHEAFVLSQRPLWERKFRASIPSAMAWAAFRAQLRASFARRRFVYAHVRDATRRKLTLAVLTPLREQLRASEWALELAVARGLRDPYHPMAASARAQREEVVSGQAGDGVGVDGAPGHGAEASALLTPTKPVPRRSSTQTTALGATGHESSGAGGGNGSIAGAAADDDITASSPEAATLAVLLKHPHAWRIFQTVVPSAKAVTAAARQPRTKVTSRAYLQQLQQTEDAVQNQRAQLQRMQAAVEERAVQAGKRAWEKERMVFRELFLKCRLLLQCCRVAVPPAAVRATLPPFLRAEPSSRWPSAEATLLAAARGVLPHSDMVALTAAVCEREGERPADAAQGPTDSAARDIDPDADMANNAAEVEEAEGAGYFAWMREREAADTMPARKQRSAAPPTFSAFAGSAPATSADADTHTPTEPMHVHVARLPLPLVLGFLSLCWALKARLEHAQQQARAQVQVQLRALAQSEITVPVQETSCGKTKNPENPENDKFLTFGVPPSSSGDLSGIISLSPASTPKTAHRSHNTHPSRPAPSPRAAPVSASASTSSSRLDATKQPPPPAPVFVVPFARAVALYLAHVFPHPAARAEFAYSLWASLHHYKAHTAVAGALKSVLDASYECVLAKETLVCEALRERTMRLCAAAAASAARDTAKAEGGPAHAAYADVHAQASAHGQLLSGPANVPAAHASANMLMSQPTHAHLRKHLVSELLTADHHHAHARVQAAQDGSVSPYTVTGGDASAAEVSLTEPAGEPAPQRAAGETTALHGPEATDDNANAAAAAADATELDSYTGWVWRLREAEALEAAMFAAAADEAASAAGTSDMTNAIAGAPLLPRQDSWATAHAGSTSLSRAPSLRESLVNSTPHTTFPTASANVSLPVSVATTAETSATDASAPLSSSALWQQASADAADGCHKGICALLTRVPPIRTVGAYGPLHYRAYALPSPPLAGTEDTNTAVDVPGAGTDVSVSSSAAHHSAAFTYGATAHNNQAAYASSPRYSPSHAFPRTDAGVVAGLPPSQGRTATPLSEEATRLLAAAAFATLPGHAQGQLQWAIDETGNFKTRKFPLLSPDIPEWMPASIRTALETARSIAVLTLGIRNSLQIPEYSLSGAANTVLAVSRAWEKRLQRELGRKTAPQPSLAALGGYREESPQRASIRMSDREPTLRLSHAALAPLRSLAVEDAADAAGRSSLRRSFSSMYPPHADTAGEDAAAPPPRPLTSLHVAALPSVEAAPPRLLHTSSRVSSLAAAPPAALPGLQRIPSGGRPPLPSGAAVGMGVGMGAYIGSLGHTSTQRSSAFSFSPSSRASALSPAPLPSFTILLPPAPSPTSLHASRVLPFFARPHHLLPHLPVPSIPATSPSHTATASSPTHHAAPGSVAPLPMPPTPLSLSPSLDVSLGKAQLLDLVHAVFPAVSEDARAALHAVVLARAVPLLLLPAVRYDRAAHSLVQPLTRRDVAPPPLRAITAAASESSDSAELPQPSHLNGSQRAPSNRAGSSTCAPVSPTPNHPERHPLPALVLPHSSPLCSPLSSPTSLASPSPLAAPDMLCAAHPWLLLLRHLPRAPHALAALAAPLAHALAGLARNADMAALVDTQYTHTPLTAAAVASRLPFPQSLLVLPQPAVPTQLQHGLLLDDSGLPAHPAFVLASYAYSAPHLFASGGLLPRIAAAYAASPHSATPLPPYPPLYTAPAATAFATRTAALHSGLCRVLGARKATHAQWVIDLLPLLGTPGAATEPLSEVGLLVAQITARAVAAVAHGGLWRAEGMHTQALGVPVAEVAGDGLLPTPPPAARGDYASRPCADSHLHLHAHTHPIGTRADAFGASRLGDAADLRREAATRAAADVAHVLLVLLHAADAHATHCLRHTHATVSAGTGNQSDLSPSPVLPCTGATAVEAVEAAEMSQVDLDVLPAPSATVSAPPSVPPPTDATDADATQVVPAINASSAGLSSATNTTATASTALVARGTSPRRTRAAPPPRSPFSVLTTALWEAAVALVSPLLLAAPALAPHALEHAVMANRSDIARVTGSSAWLSAPPRASSVVSNTTSGNSVASTTGHHGDRALGPSTPTELATCVEAIMAAHTPALSVPALPALVEAQTVISTATTAPGAPPASAGWGVGDREAEHRDAQDEGTPHTYARSSARYGQLFASADNRTTHASTSIAGAAAANPMAPVHTAIAASLAAVPANHLAVVATIVDAENTKLRPLPGVSRVWSVSDPVSTRILTAKQQVRGEGQGAAAAQYSLLCVVGAQMRASMERHVESVEKYLLSGATLELVSDHERGLQKLVGQVATLLAKQAQREYAAAARARTGSAGGNSFAVLLGARSKGEDTGSDGESTRSETISTPRQLAPKATASAGSSGLSATHGHSVAVAPHPLAAPVKKPPTHMVLPADSIAAALTAADPSLSPAQLAMYLAAGFGLPLPRADWLSARFASLCNGREGWVYPDANVIPTQLSVARTLWLVTQALEAGATYEALTGVSLFSDFDTESGYGSRPSSTHRSGIVDGTSQCSSAGGVSAGGEEPRDSRANSRSSSRATSPSARARHADAESGAIHDGPVAILSGCTCGAADERTLLLAMSDTDTIVGGTCTCGGDPAAWEPAGDGCMNTWAAYESLAAELGEDCESRLDSDDVSDGATALPPGSSVSSQTTSDDAVLRQSAVLPPSRVAGEYTHTVPPLQLPLLSASALGTGVFSPVTASTGLSVLSANPDHAEDTFRGSFYLPDARSLHSLPFMQSSQLPQPQLSHAHVPHQPSSQATSQTILQPAYVPPLSTRAQSRAPRNNALTSTQGVATTSSATSRSPAIVLVRGVPTIPAHPADCYASVGVRALNYLRTHRHLRTATTTASAATPPTTETDEDEALDTNSSSLYADTDVAVGVDAREGVSMKELLHQLDPSTTVPIAHFLKNLTTRMLVVPGYAYKESELEGYI